MRSSILKRVARLLPVLHLPLLSQLITSPRTLSPHPSPWRNHLRQPTGNSAARRAASCRAKTPARRSSRVISVRKFEFFLPIAVLAATRYGGDAITNLLLSPKTKEPGVRENHSCRTTSTTIFLIYFNQFYRISLDGGGGSYYDRREKTAVFVTTRSLHFGFYFGISVRWLNVSECLFSICRVSFSTH